MKKKSIYLLVIIAVATLLLTILTLKVQASDYANEPTKTSGDWQYVEVNGKATITKYIGASKQIVIPNTLDGLKVSAIEAGTIDFEDMMINKDVYISSITFMYRDNDEWTDSYIEINEKAFININYADENFAFYIITDGDQNPSLAEKLFNDTEADCFSGMPYIINDDDGLIYDSDAEDIELNSIYSSDIVVTIPNQVPYINDNGSLSNYTVKIVDCESGEVVIPNALVVDFPTGLERITEAYFDNEKIRKITLPSSLNNIDSNAFSYSTTLYCYVGYPVRYARNNGYDYVVLDPEYKVDLSEEYGNEASDMVFNIDNSSAYVYENKNRKISIKEWYGYTLEENIDYWYYDDGRGTICISGEGNYMGTIEVYYDVKKMDLSKVKATINTKDAVYTGKSITKSVRLVTSYGYELDPYYNDGEWSWGEYKVSYKNNKNTGKATITIKGIGDYFKGTITKTFRIVPKKATISSVKNSKGKKAKITWKKDTQATGYEVYMATSKNGKYSKIKTVTKNKTVTYTKTKLKKNKKYYFKVRSYKTIDGKKVCGSYSSAKTVTIKK